MNEKQTEQMLQDKGLNAPRLSTWMIDDTISKVEYHIFGGTQLTVCCMTLKNGFTVTGESACASPENFDKEIGENIAYKMARNKVWELEGYLLKQKLYEENK